MSNRRSKRAAMVIAVVWGLWTGSPAPLAADDRRPILITVDDLPVAGRLHTDASNRSQITDSLLGALKRHDIRAVALVTWGNVNGDEDVALLERWLAAGHELGNHSHHHLSYTATATEQYLSDIESGRQNLAALLAKHERQIRFFRFPYLREGSTPDKLKAMRSYLGKTGQRNLPVTLDNQDWSFERPWIEAARRNDTSAMAQVADAYHESIHLSIRHHARTGQSLFGRPVPEILLLHANEVGAAQWDRLFTWLKAEGYRFADVDEVLADSAFAEPHNYVGPRGPSLWDRLLVGRRHRETRTEIEALIAKQVDAWNRGDLEGFCAEYTEDTVFISPSGRTQGRQQVLERYLARYPDRAAQGHLKIEILDFKGHDGTEISMLGDARPSRIHSASVVGRWTLKYSSDPSRADLKSSAAPIKEDATGLTLLVFGHDAQGNWKIVRDASM